MLKNINAILFDAADTLFYIKDGLGITYAEPARKYGIEPSPYELNQAFSKYFHSAPPLAFNVVDDIERKRLEKQWWYMIVRNVYNDIGMFNEFDSYFNDLFEIFRTSAWEIYPETISVLSEFKQRDYLIIVVSNFDSRVYDVCNNLGITEYLDDFVISSETGYAKPDPHIYKIALDRNNLDPSQCIFIGDNYLNDYVVPISLGMRAKLLNRDSENDKYDVQRIKNLSELL